MRATSWKFGITLICLSMASVQSMAEIGAQDAALPPIKSAGSGEQGRILVNGKPFFPILMYDVPVDAATLKMLREHGFNVLSARAEDGELLRTNGFYAAAHGSNTANLNLDGVLFGVGMDSPALNWKDNLLERCRMDLANMQKAFPNRPIFHAIGYWEDEPEGVYNNKLPSKEKYEELVKVLDVSAPYLYPVPYQPVRSVGEALARADVAGGGRKSLLPVLQTFAWKPDDRYPTLAELKCMVYLSLIHGADGIGYYSYNYVAGKQGTNIAREQPDLWAAVKSINSEVKLIGEILLNSKPDVNVKLTSAVPEVEWRAVSTAKSMLILLANTTDDPQTVRVQPGMKVTRLNSLDRGSNLQIEDGSVPVKLGPYESLALRGEK